MAKSEFEKTMAQFEKKYGARSGNEIKIDKRMPTGIYALDYILGGGICDCPGGHRIELYGSESSGKTTIAYLTVKKFQEDGKLVAWLDMENSFDSEWPEILGVDINNLAVFKPTHLEQAGDLLIDLIKSDFNLIILDGITSLPCDAEIERDTDEPTMAIQARVLSLICRKANNALTDTNKSLIFINQKRENVGQRYGNPETTPGGRHLKHFYNTRVEIKTTAPIKKGSGINEERIGTEVKIRCTKNKKGSPFKTAVYDFYYNGTVDNKKSIFFSALKFGIIELNGKTYSYGDYKSVGKDNFINEFTDWDKVYKELMEVQK